MSRGRIVKTINQENDSKQNKYQFKEWVPNLKNKIQKSNEEC